MLMSSHLSVFTLREWRMKQTSAFSIFNNWVRGLKSPVHEQRTKSVKENWFLSFLEANKAELTRTDWSLDVVLLLLRWVTLAWWKAPYSLSVLEEVAQPMLPRNQWTSKDWPTCRPFQLSCVRRGWSGVQQKQCSMPVCSPALCAR